MKVGDIGDAVFRSVETVQAKVGETLFEPTIRLGVTGLSRAGKTVFITSLITNLIENGRMPQLQAAADGAIHAAYLQPQPDDTVPRFEYEKHLASLSATPPQWPASTSNISELRLSLRVQPTGFFGALSGPKTIHLDIVDYPGEWLLDLGLLDKTYEEWVAAALARMENQTFATAFLDAVRATDASAPYDESVASSLAKGFTKYLHKARAAGFSDCTPGRFLLPGDLAGSPVLTFAPCLKPARASRKSLCRQMERRFDAYKSKVVRPFFKDHFARLDRQIVLIDVLGAIHAGPAATEDLRQSLADVLQAFRPGRNSFLASIFGGRRIDRVLFAATKADHLHHSQHGRLTAITTALLAQAKQRADFSGAQTKAMSLASVRATSEATIKHDGVALDCVQGTLEGGKEAAFYPGELPDDPARILGPAADSSDKWLDADYQIMSFLPSATARKTGAGLAHIRLDKALQFLIGDKL